MKNEMVTLGERLENLRLQSGKRKEIGQFTKFEE